MRVAYSLNFLLEENLKRSSDHRYYSTGSKVRIKDETITNIPFETPKSKEQNSHYRIIDGEVQKL